MAVSASARFHFLPPNYNHMNAIIEQDRTKDSPYHREVYPVLVVLSGPSGVGKDSVVQRLMERDTNFHFVVTATTRPPRSNETHGVDYFFLSEGEFARMIEQGELLEHALVHDNYKGVPKQQVRDALNSGKDVIMRVDPQGAATLRQIVPNAVFIFLMAESEQALAERLQNRRSETGDELALRLAVARDELKRIEEFDYCVVNHEDRLEETVEKIMCIVTATKCRAYQEPIDL